MRLVVVKRIGPMDAFMFKDHYYKNLVQAVSDAENDLETVRHVLAHIQDDSAYRRKKRELRPAIDAVTKRKKELAQYQANDENQFRYRTNKAYERGDAYEIVETALKGGTFWKGETVQWPDLKDLMTRVEKKEYRRLKEYHDSSWVLQGLADLESVVVEDAASSKEGDELTGDVNFDHYNRVLSPGGLLAKTGLVKIRTHIRTQTHKDAGEREGLYSAGYSVGGIYYVVKTDESDENVVAALRHEPFLKRGYLPLKTSFADLAA
jgi:hypothetical protein